MSADDPGAATTRQYEIRVKGHLGSRWAAWFDGLSLTDEDDGTTVMRGPVVDQDALHGVLQKLRDVGIPWSPSLRSHHVTNPPSAPRTDPRKEPAMTTMTRTTAARPPMRQRRHLAR